MSALVVGSLPGRAEVREGGARSLTAANQPQAPPELRAALSAITRRVDDYANRARLPHAA